MGVWLLGNWYAPVDYFKEEVAEAYFAAKFGFPFEPVHLLFGDHGDDLGRFVTLKAIGGRV